MQELTQISPTVDSGEVKLIASNHRRLKIMRERHRFMLGLSIIVIVAALLLRVGDSGHVQPKWLPNLPLPVMCGSRAFFGIECPGCGLTRSFVALAGGDLDESLAFHRIGWVLALAVVLQIPYRLFLLRELRFGVPERKWPELFGRALIFLLIGNWILNQFGV